MFQDSLAVQWHGDFRPTEGGARVGRLLVLVGLILLAGFLAIAPAAAQEFSLNRYTQKSGLRNLGIEQFVFDHNGDMWLATDGGVYRYDGISFIPYDKSRGIPADATMAIAASPSGRIFTRVDAGLYSGNADHFEPVLTAEGPVIADQYTMLVAPADDRVLYLRDHQIMQVERSGGPGSLWKARALFSAARIAEHPELALVQGLIDVDDGRLWFGCGLHLCNLDDTKLKVYGVAEGVPEAEYGALVQDRHGGIWARSPDRLVMLERGVDHFQVIDPPHVKLASRVRRLTLTLDPMGRIVTRTGLGLARRSGTSWQEFSSRNGFPDSPITTALADDDGNFWLAVGGIGLYRWHGYDNLESWTKNQGLVPESVWNIVRDQQHRPDSRHGSGLPDARRENAPDRAMSLPGVSGSRNECERHRSVRWGVVVLPDFAAMAGTCRRHDSPTRDHGAGPFRCRGDSI